MQLRRVDARSPHPQDRADARTRQWYFNLHQGEICLAPYQLRRQVLMANPVVFKPVTVDFKADLKRSPEKAPDEHTAALLSAHDVLEAAHEKGLLDNPARHDRIQGYDHHHARKLRQPAGRYNWDTQAADGSEKAYRA
jgi:hypothetical protein